MSVIWVVCDRFSKMVHLVPLSKLPSSSDLVPLFFQHVVRLYGIPENIVSDRGSQFVSRFWQAFCARMGIDLSFSSAFHPQTNGQTERTNQTLETYLRCFVSADQDDWVSFLPLAEFALNNRASSATLVSPFFCNSGFHPRFSSGKVESSDCPGVDTVVDRLQQIWTHVVDNLTLSQEKAQRFANHRRCVGPRLRVGDLVWLSSRYIPMKVSSPKFKPRFIGPYRISEVLNPVSFRLTLPASFSIHNVFHRSLLRRYVAPVVPSIDPPAPVLVEGELEYIVEKILDSRVSRRKLQYLVKWKGYGQEDNSWVFASDVHAADLVRAFHVAHPGRPGGSGQVESSDCPGVDTVVDRLQQIWTHVVDNLTLSQEKAQRFANRRRCVGPRLRVGDLVWLSSRYIPMKVSSPKFKPCFIGPYRISEVLNPVSFRLTLPASFSIHNVFHRSLLRRYVAPVVPSVDPPAPVLVEGELEYIVEKILDSRISRRKLQYLVKWKGYGQEDNSWVFASDVHAADLVRAFHLAHPGRPGGSAFYIGLSCLLEALGRRGSTSVPLVGAEGLFAPSAWLFVGFVLTAKLSFLSSVYLVETRICYTYLLASIKRSLAFDVGAIEGFNSTDYTVVEQGELLDVQHTTCLHLPKWADSPHVAVVSPLGKSTHESAVCLKRFSAYQNFIAEYIKTQRIPRGLRVSLRPTLFQDNSDFCSRFEQILHKCSVDLMSLTLDQLNKEIKNSQDKVSSIETQLKDSLPKDEFDSVKTRTKENVDNFRKETEKRKRQKFIRDTQDYLQKRVYRWQNSSFRPNYRGYRYTDGSSASSLDNERMEFHRPRSEIQHTKRTRRGGQCFRDKSSPHEHQVSGNESNLVINISNKSLNTSQLRLLEKGLSFCPTYKFNAFQLNVDLKRFYRNLRLKAYFCEQTPMTTQAVVTKATPINLKDLGLKLRSNFSPPKSCAPVETFITLIDREVTNFCKQIVRGDFTFRSNLGQTERMALKTLMSDKDIVIKAADKGGAIVIMDYSFYCLEILSQLANRNVYQPLTNNPTPSIRNKITVLLDEALSTGIIDKKTKEFLTNEYPIVPVFYVLPKIHKNLERPPGRPIVASMDSILSPLSILLEKCAQCANVLKGPKISHPQTDSDIPIQGFFTCNSKEVVYAIKCPCGKIYVGETTQAIKDRISHHKSDIRCGKYHLPIPNHFREAGCRLILYFYTILTWPTRSSVDFSAAPTLGTTARYYDAHRSLAFLSDEGHDSKRYVKTGLILIVFWGLLKFAAKAGDLGLVTVTGLLEIQLYRDEILRPLVRPYAGAVGTGFLQMQDNARPHVAGVCQQFQRDDLNPIEHIWDVMSRTIHQCHVAPQTIQDLADALVQVWEEIPQETIRRR
ncbi:unnamed protein product, partial [Ranitomeya imitator]